MGSERKVVAPTSAETGQPVQISDQQLATGLEVFGRIADLWGLSGRECEIVLGLHHGAYERWRASRVMPERVPHIEERLSYVVRIYAALTTLLPLPDRAAAWVKQPNTAPLFGGRSALDRMLGGQVGDLKAIADYLDGQV